MTCYDAIRINGPLIEMHGKVVGIWTGNDFDRDEVESMGLFYATEDERAEELEAAELKADTAARIERTEEIMTRLDSVLQREFEDESELTKKEDELIQKMFNIVEELRSQFEPKPDPKNAPKSNT